MTQFEEEEEEEGADPEVISVILINKHTHKNKWYSLAPRFPLSPTFSPATSNEDGN